MSNYRIAPSILSADFARLGEEVRNVVAAGADIIHFDVMDNHFVPNLTLGQPVVEKLIQSVSTPVDCHLMIENPEKWAAGYAEVGARSVTFHVEAAKADGRWDAAAATYEKHAAVTTDPARWAAETGMAMHQRIRDLAAQMFEVPCVSVCGAIGFVGLIAPFVARRLSNGHPGRAIVPAAAIGSAESSAAIAAMVSSRPIRTCQSGRCTQPVTVRCPRRPVCRCRSGRQIGRAHV